MEMPAPPPWYGWFTCTGKSELLVVDGKVNQQCYIGIFLQNLLPWAPATFQRNFVLVRDNATPRTAQSTPNLPAGDEVEVLQWLAQCPDLEPIKYLRPNGAVYQRYG